MNKTFAAAILAATALSAGPASATIGRNVSVPTAATAAPILRPGMPISLRTVDAVPDAARAAVGQRLRVETAAPILIDGEEAVPAGTPGTAEIVAVRSRATSERPARIVARLVSLTAEGHDVRIAGGIDDVAAGAEPGSIPAGTPLRGFIDEQVALVQPAPEIRTASAVPVHPDEVEQAPVAVAIRTVEIPASAPPATPAKTVEIRHPIEIPGLAVLAAAEAARRSSPDRERQTATQPARLRAVSLRTTKSAMAPGDTVENMSDGVLTRYSY